MSELQNMKGSQHDKMKMLKFLQKQQQQENEVGQLESRDAELSQRLDGIHMDDFEGVWDRLTEHERFVFQERVRTGNVDFLDRWRPWWNSEER